VGRDDPTRLPDREKQRTYLLVRAANSLLSSHAIDDVFRLTQMCALDHSISGLRVATVSLPLTSLKWEQCPQRGTSLTG